MKITVELPDDVAKHADPGRAALEALAIEGYRAGALTTLSGRSNCSVCRDSSSIC